MSEALVANNLPIPNAVGSLDAYIGAVHRIPVLEAAEERELAQRYFQHSDCSPTEITFALGFSDPSNFYRACKRWFGRSPSTMRCTN